MLPLTAYHDRAPSGADARAARIKLVFAPASLWRQPKRPHVGQLPPKRAIRTHHDPVHSRLQLDRSNRVLVKRLVAARRSDQATRAAALGFDDEAVAGRRVVG